MNDNLSRRKLVRQLGLCLISVLLGGVMVAVGLGFVSVAQAAGITVTTTTDVISDDGFCSLREAVRAANLDTASGATPGECPAGSGADTIIVPAGTYALTLTGMSDEIGLTGDLDITDTVTIAGAGPAATLIDGFGSDRVFDIGPVAASVAVTIENVTIRNGRSSSDGGGVIMDGPTLTISNSIIVSNTTAAANSGGGIAVYTGNLLLINSTVVSNTATDIGGGIRNGASLTIVDSTIVSNTATNDGGGIANFLGATLTLTNSTISGNAATANGGGIFNDATAALTNVTLSANGAATGGGIRNAAATVTISNTIVANSVSGGDCANNGTVTDGGNNIVEDNTCGFTGGSDPNLGPLQDNGGPTLTHALLSGSPAIDAGNNCPATDQRGVTRPQGATCDIGAYENEAPTISDIPDQSTAEDTPTGAIAFTVGDVETAAASLTLSRDSSNLTLVPLGSIALGGSGSSRTVTITPTADLSGTAIITVTVDDGDFTTMDAFTLTVTTAADTPSVTNATTNEDAQTTTGLVISRNAVDGAEVTHFKITAITNGTLYQNDGTTPIVNGDFITFAQGNAGLKFTPTANFSGTGSFTVQASTSASDPGLGGSTVTANITVNAVADTPSVTNATTDEDTQTSSGLVISRNAADGAEVTHFKITGITNGTLYQNDGTTPLSNGDFITFAQGNAGLKFTPASHFFGTGSFTVQAALSAADGGLGGSTVTANITVNAVADTPSVTGAATNEDTQTSSGLVISRHAADGAEVTHFKITGITNGTLYQNDGTTPIADGDFITFAQGNAGLRFTPTANFNGTGSFSVQASTSASDPGLGDSTVTATITVAGVNDAPVNSVPGTQSTIKNAALVFSSGNGNQISVADVDAGSSPIRVTLTATNGTLTLAAMSGLTFSVGDGTADATMTFTGTASAINTALNGMSFIPTTEFYGTASLQIATNDQGNTGAGGALSDTDAVTINVNAYLVYLPLIIRQP